MERLAKQLAEFHAGAATGVGVAEFGSLATLRANWDENFAQTSDFLGRTITAQQYAEIHTYVEQFLEAHAELLKWRVEQGCIRDGHGDLHASSV